ncbi:hypothetical protein [Pararcticibacter amylolyticus]|uniref:Uncharacterized protein n=1 Tax=Pararcticibacter amylolyticus TaxID=2173175 RepID=A0A2U2PDT6_9SPHI|nr:hypothetical protein [Pararcticibacter amylolyticus]PWG79533.1 hypothetical protein DDR33_15790 [Pararcticibacter amylolyticus]
MYEKEYRKLVVDAFEQKLAEGSLPPELIAPTRKSLRDHCIKVCTERYDKKDEPMLRAFFGGKENAFAYRIAIQNTKAEKFRTLHNFLKDRSKETSFPNISMLAWMINFEPRPFRCDLEAPGTRSPGHERQSESVSEPQSELPETPPLPPPPDSGNPGDGDPSGGKPGGDSPSGGFRIKKILGYVSAVLLAGSLITYGVIAYRKYIKNENGGCMIWTGEKYKRVVCSYKSEDPNISAKPLDTAVLRYFKKITKDDTLTANSIGKVFCVKIRGQYEFYTDSAEHPLYNQIRLRPLTQFIMNNNRN